MAHNMNKLQQSARKTVLLTLGKALTLCGVALTFAACYGTPPRDPNAPDYWAQKNSAEETLYGAGQSEKSVPAIRGTRAETPEEQESQSEHSPLSLGE